MELLCLLGPPGWFYFGGGVLLHPAAYGGSVAVGWSAGMFVEDETSGASAPFPEIPTTLICA